LRILICAECPPLPPVSGLRLMLLALIKELRRKHEVRVVCLATPTEAQLCEAGITTPVIFTKRRWLLPTSLAHATLTGRPLRLDKLARAIERPLAEELGRFDPDVVHVTGELASLGKHLATPSVLAPLDAPHRNWEAQRLEARPLRRPFLASEVDRVRRFEQTEYPAFDRVVVVSEEDRDALSELSAEMRVVVIPNGVDSNYFAPDDAGPDPDTVAFHGTLDWAPNVMAAQHLAEQIWPHVLEQARHARLLLIGRYPTAKVRALGRQPSITVTGGVPDVRPWLRRAAVYACPMISGAGIKNKLLEAMALGLACVATSRALGGLEVEPGKHVIVADDEKEFAAAIVSLIRDDERRTALARAGREYVRRGHSWERVAQQYTAIYQEVRASP
jgi:polysaccharide biosynthesis protein PslH